MHWNHHKSWLCLPVCLPSPQGNPNLLLGAGEGVHVCIDETQRFVFLVWFFYPDALLFAWACGPLIQVKGGYCPAEITPNDYYHATAMMPLNDCEVLKHQWLIWTFPCFLQTHHIKVVDHLFQDRLVCWHLHNSTSIFLSTSWTACLLFSFYASDHCIFFSSITFLVLVSM